MEQKVSSVIRLLVTIVDRGKGQGVADLLKRGGSLFHTILLGHGTAKKELLDYLGLGETEKDVVLSALSAEIGPLALRRLNQAMRLDVPGGGIAFTIPIASVGGAKTLSYLKGEPAVAAPIKQEVSGMEQELYELVITIVNRGFTDRVMDAAGKAGARGGTVLHARGAGQEEAAKFFGITIQPEKEVVMILVKREQKQAVMQEICKGVGLNTEGHGLSFSLPVDQVTGVARMMIENEEGQ